MRDDVKAKARRKEYGSVWERQRRSRPTRKKTGELANEKNLDLPPNKQVTAWDCMYFIDYHDVLTYSHDMWQKHFAKRLHEARRRAAPRRLEEPPRLGPGSQRDPQSSDASADPGRQR